jgi:mycofactocin system glycosyltransferase
VLGTRYRLDSSWRRPAGGNVVVAGSPLRLFRLSTGGAQVAAMVEVGEAPDTAAVHQMLDRFVEAGALHPQHPTAPFRPAQVTIVVPAFGPLQASLVEQLARHPGPVVVVDDAGPAPFGNDAPPDRVQLVRHERNQGPAAARNTGLALVTTPLVAFLDTDVTPDGDWLLPLLTHFADERVALVAPRVMGAPGDTRLHEYEQRHSSLDLGDEPARIAAGTRVSYVPAAALVCRVAALRAIDGFDADMRVGEDVDLVWRLAAAGYRCRYEPAGQVRHTPRATISAWCRQRMGYGRSAAPLAQRHPGALAPVRMSGWSALAWVLLVARHPLLALGVAAGTSAALVRKLHDLPPRDAALLAARGPRRGRRPVGRCGGAGVVARGRSGSSVRAASTAGGGRGVRTAGGCHSGAHSIRAAAGGPAAEHARPDELRGGCVAGRGGRANGGAAAARLHELAATSRRVMSLQSSHTSAGMTPTRMRPRNITQPRQNENTDSSVAAITKPDTSA